MNIFFIMNFKITLFIFSLAVLIITPNISRSQSGNGLKEEPGYFYDMVDPKTLEIDADFNLEHYSANTNANAKKVQVNIKADLKYFNAPSLTFRYGLIKNLEFQVITGYIGVLTDASATIKTKNNRIISASKNATGLNSLSLGLKAGLLSNIKSRPSITFTGLVTLPNIGNPAFTPNTTGVDLSLGLYNYLSDKIDISYGLGTVWSGYKGDDKNSYNYNISPGYTFSDNFGLYLDFAGVMQQGSSSDNRFDMDLSFTLSDYITLDAYAGTSFNIKRFYFIGSTFTATIPF
jgi:hypothetical protein